VTDWIVRRWARYGHERLYAETPGGTALGYLDLKTGRYHSDDLSNLPLLEKAIGDHLADREPKQGESDAPVEEAEALAVDALLSRCCRHGKTSAATRLVAQSASGRLPHVIPRARSDISWHAPST